MIDNDTDTVTDSGDSVMNIYFSVLISYASKFLSLFIYYFEFCSCNCPVSCYVPDVCVEYFLEVCSFWCECPFVVVYAVEDRIPRDFPWMNEPILLFAASEAT